VYRRERAASGRVMLTRLATVLVLALAGGPGALSAAVAQDDTVAPAQSGSGDWPTWQHDPVGSRFNRAEKRINPSTVAGLRLEWAFAYPKVNQVTSGSQPAVVDGTLYVGGPDARFYALDARTGVTRWSFDLATVAGPWDARSPNPVRDGPAVAHGRVYFADTRGYLYALHTDTGQLAWATRLDDHIGVRITSSPLVFSGRVYVGVSSSEKDLTIDPTFPCCTFRGQVVALDARTGSVRWRYFTVPPPQPAGTWPSGAAKYAPSGVAVWSSPVVDPATRTLYVGTGQNYTGTAGDADSVLALDADTGAVRWKQQMTRADTWTLACLKPAPGDYCPGLADGTALNYDFGSSANIFQVNGRTLVGIGQKSGVFHTFDAATGEIVWQTQLAVPQANGGATGIQWGSSYDGRSLYVASWQAAPGTLFALDPASGEIRWANPNPSDGCTRGGAASYPDFCLLALTPAVTSSPGLVYEGSADGKLRIYAASTGETLWEYDTIRDFDSVNGLPGRGSALSGNGGAVVSNGMLYVQSGYYPFYPSDRGYVLLAFGL